VHFNEGNNSCKPINTLYYNLGLQYLTWLVHVSALLSLHHQGVDTKYF